MGSRTPMLPEDVMDTIFSYVQPHEVLRGRALSNARSVLTLSDVPAATKSIEQVIELDATPPIRDVQPCPGALLKPIEIMFVVATAKNLQKIRVSHVSGSCFIPMLRYIEDLEFLDSEDVDITHIASVVSTITVHKPTKQTLETLTCSGQLLKNVTLIAVQCSLTAEVDTLLKKWASRLVSVKVLFKEPCPDDNPYQSNKAMLDIISSLVLGREQFSVLKTVKIGRYDDIESELEAPLLEMVQNLTVYEDAQFLCYRQRIDTLFFNIGRRIATFGYEMHPLVLVDPRAFHETLELNLLDVRAINSRSNDESYKREIFFIAYSMKQLTHLSIRVRVVLNESAIDCDVFNFIRFFLEARRTITLLEVTKDFILLPMVCRDMAKMIFCKMDNVQNLVVTSTPRKVYHYAPHVPGGAAGEARNKIIAKAIPKFLEFVNEHCPLMDCVFLADFGVIDYSAPSEGKAIRYLLLAMDGIKQFEKHNSRTDISSVKCQIEGWLKSLLPESHNGQLSNEALRLLEARARKLLQPKDGTYC